ncbi:Zinc finger, MYND-type [Corchorus olitorius]|uniref:Zinc finger, MYND-type n=1 Tax=Corchorus olitorius TaxID=93759 RepID=A0A1R3J599_9ROSI|nr:Zinc finger, MYND-type [Corchorus olitorius]
MEKLKGLVPESVKRRAAESSCDDLACLSSSLVDLFLSLPEFHQLIADLVDSNQNHNLCGKNKEAALHFKQKGNHFYSTGDHSQALRCYSQALRLAPLDADDNGKNLVATLYLNRASLFHAWYRRGKVNASLGNYEDALHDLTVARNMEPSLGGKKQIENELDILAQPHEGKSTKPVDNNQKSVGIPDKPQHIKLHCVTTPDKGRGMASQFDIPEASLIHTEEPYAVVILKHCRETHCHYCLNELPADTIPCVSCSMPLYCSQHCQVQAGGQIHMNYSSNMNIHESKSDCIQEHIKDITAGRSFDQKLECVPEHKHECGGVHWPAVLPSDVVLAGRVVVKAIEQKGQVMEVPNFLETLGFCQSYSKMPPESKLELNIYSIVLLFCLRHSYSSEISINGVSASQIVILLSQIRVNSMAIVRMKSSDAYDQQDWFQKFFSGEAEAALTSSVEQVRVGQALYRVGSLFNHSCKPNIHVYFISRSLLIRTTEFVGAGCPMELSYGPQVGQWDCKDRLKLLKEEYFFRCQCCGCSEVNASDLVINGFCCVNTNCSGVVLDHVAANCEKQKLKIPGPISVESHSQVNKVDDIDIQEVAQVLLDKKCTSLCIDSGYCLKCGSYRNLASLSEAVKNAWIPLRRLQDDSVTLRDVHHTELSDAVKSLGLLRSILHAYNKGVAEAEDNLAQAFYFTGDLESARDHCKASIEILEKLYGPNHIVIGYELVKLSSIQLSLGDFTAADSINRLNLIFSRYYGQHAGIIFPYLHFLKRES